MVTLKDVARLAGVTPTTISRMLNNKCNVSAKTRRKIEDAMQTLAYRPNELARSLSKQTSGFIGLIVPSVTQFFFSSVIERVEASAAANGCKLLLCVSNQDAKKEKEYFNMLMGNRVMGIILCNLTQAVEDLGGIDAPLMVLERTPSKSIPYALSDNYNGGRLAAEHLIDKGCKRLLYFAGNTDVTFSPDPMRRYDGFCDVCHERGVADPILWTSDWEEFIAMRYDASIQHMFEACPQTDGILASNDSIAAQLIRSCMRRGVRVPEDMKVVGYDDTVFAASCIVPLTTIHQPIDELCRFAVESIIHRAHGEVVPESTVFPVQLVVREST